MSYPKEIYLKAERILEKRRDNAVMEAQLRAEKIREDVPEIDKLQGELSGIGLEISRLFFYRENAPEKVEELRAKSKALTDKRAQLLVKNGYAENAMQPEYVCSVCEDRGFVSGRLCTCHRATVVRRGG